jgi:hypothetical protein
MLVNRVRSTIREVFLLDGMRQQYLVKWEESIAIGNSPALAIEF